MWRQRSRTCLCQCNRLLRAQRDGGRAQRLRADLRQPLHSSSLYSLPATSSRKREPINFAVLEKETKNMASGMLPADLADDLAKQRASARSYDAWKTEQTMSAKLDINKKKKGRKKIEKSKQSGEVEKSKNSFYGLQWNSTTLSKMTKVYEKLEDGSMIVKRKSAIGTAHWNTTIVDDLFYSSLQKCTPKDWPVFVCTPGSLALAQRLVDAQFRRVAILEAHPPTFGQLKKQTRLPCDVHLADLGTLSSAVNQSFYMGNDLVADLFDQYRGPEKKPVTFCGVLKPGHAEKFLRNWLHCLLRPEYISLFGVLHPMNLFVYVPIQAAIKWTCKLGYDVEDYALMRVRCRDDVIYGQYTLDKTDKIYFAYFFKNYIRQVATVADCLHPFLEEYNSIIDVMVSRLIPPS